MSHNNHPSKLCIRARYNGQIKCLELDWNEINSDEFTKQCKFQILFYCSDFYRRKIE